MTGSPPDVPQGSTAAAPQPGGAAAARGPSDPTTRPTRPAPDASSGGLSGLEIAVALVMLLSAAGLSTSAERSAAARIRRRGDAGTPAVTASATTEPAPSRDTGHGGADSGGSRAALLAGVADVGSPRLPGTSCQAGADAVTCSNPAPNIRTVVLTPYSDPGRALRGVHRRGREPLGRAHPENTGNCSDSESEGEVGWNLDKAHTFDFSVAQQADGGLDPASESAGRMFCTDSQKVMTLVWTQDPGLLVTVTGQPSELVVTWWQRPAPPARVRGGAEGQGCAA